ncbi:TPA: hypothetical protein ACFP4A_000639 [Neisseria subflava]
MNAQQYEESFLLAEKLITQNPPDFARAILCSAKQQKPGILRLHFNWQDACSKTTKTNKIWQLQLNI